MFNRSLTIVDERVTTLSLDFSQLLVAQTHVISEGITELSTYDFAPAKISTLSQAHDHLSNELLPLKNLTDSNAISAQQQTAFVSIRALKNKIRQGIESVRNDARHAFEENEEKFLANDILRRMTSSIQQQVTSRASASVAAAVRARQSSETPPESQNSITALTNAYDELLVLNELRQTLDENETKLEYKWRELVDARANYLTSSELALMAHSSPPHANQKVAQQVLTLIQTKLPIPLHLEQALSELETDVGIQHQNLRMAASAIVPLEKRKSFDEALAMIRATILGFVASEVKMLDKMLNRHYLQQMTIDPKAELAVLTSWVKERDAQFKNSIGEARLVLLNIKTTLTGEAVAKKPSWLERTGFFNKKLAKNKVMPTQDPVCLPKNPGNKSAK